MEMETSQKEIVSLAHNLMNLRKMTMMTLKKASQITLKKMMTMILMQARSLAKKDWIGTRWKRRQKEKIGRN